MSYIITVGKLLCSKDSYLTGKSEPTKLENILSADTNKQKINIDHYINKTSLENNLPSILLCCINLHNGIKNNISEETLDFFLSSLLKSSLLTEKHNW
jgi:hypothetical protein